jgi:hypothetical protein
MTIQVPDHIIYEGERLLTWSFPLEPYYEDHPPPRFGIFHTGLRRGYVATWGLEGETLYLIGIEVRRPDGTVAGLAELFPGRGAKVEATWFSGEIRICAARDPTVPRRRCDRLLIFQNGRLVRSELGDPCPG